MRPILVGVIASLALLAAPSALAALAPAVSTGSAMSVTASSATLTGTVNPEGQATTYQFEYGPTSAYGTTTTSTSAGSGTSATPAMATIGSLTPNTTYHYRIDATSASGTTPGTDKTFTTSKSPSMPTVTTRAAKSVTASSATLTGTVNPEGQATTYQFRYGLTTSYGNTTPSTSAGSGTSDVAAAAPISSLTPDTTYHYRLVATNASGAATGADRTFKTAKPSSVTIAPSPSTITFGQATTLKGKGPGRTTITLQGSASTTGPFVNVASTTSSNGGAYSFVQAPASNTFYRAFAGGVNSAPTRVKVSFRISLFVGSTHPPRGHLVRFSGSVAPGPNGFRMRIQRLGSNGFWRTLARPRLHSTVGNASTYSIRIAVRRGGLYRATVAPDANHARGFSPDIRIRVH